MSVLLSCKHTTIAYIFLEGILWGMRKIWSTFNICMNWITAVHAPTVSIQKKKGMMFSEYTEKLYSNGQNWGHLKDKPTYYTHNNGKREKLVKTLTKESDKYAGNHQIFHSEQHLTRCLPTLKFFW